MARLVNRTWHLVSGLRGIVIRSNLNEFSVFSFVQTMQTNHADKLRLRPISGILRDGIGLLQRSVRLGMSYRPLALAAVIATLSSVHVTSAEAQSVYVAPAGGIYIGPGAAPLYVRPGAPAAAYAAGRDYGYGPDEPDYGHGYEPTPRYGYGPAPRYGYGFGPGPDHAYGPAPRYGYGFEPAPDCSCEPAPRYGYGPTPRYGYEPPPRYGYEPGPRYGYEPGPRDGYGPMPRYGYRYEPAPRRARPPRTPTHPPSEDAAALPPHLPAPSAGRR